MIRKIDILARIEELALIHHRLGITFTAEMWQVVKWRITDAARRSDRIFHDKQETARVWMKFANFFTTEMDRALKRLSYSQ